MSGLRPENHVLEFVDDYLHELLGPEDAAAVAEHCGDCPICTVAMQEARKRAAALAAVPPCRAPRLLIARASENVRRVAAGATSPRKQATLTALYLGAAAVLALATLSVFVHRLSPSPYDLRVLGQKQWVIGSSASLRLAIFNQRTGQLAPNIPISVALVNPQTNERSFLASVNSRELGDGAPRFHVPDWKPGEYEMLVVAQTPDGNEVVRRPITLRRARKLTLTTDKPAYQKGQTIFVRALAVRTPDFKPAAKEYAELAVIDPRGNTIARWQGVTSPFGMAAASCPLSREAREGGYLVRCKLGETVVERIVQVREAADTQWRVQVLPDRPLYRPDQTAKIVVRALAAGGQPAGVARVQLEVFAGAKEALPFFTAAGALNEQGEAQLEAPLRAVREGEFEAMGAADLEFVATVTREDAVQYAASAVRPLSGRPLRIDVWPENGRLVQGLVNRVYVLARTVDGRGSKTRLEISGDVTKTLETSDAGLGVLEITPSGASVSLKVKATDAQGLTSSETAALSCGTADADFLLRTDKCVYRGGEKLVLELLGKGPAPIFIDLMSAGQTVVTDMLELTDGKAVKEIELPGDVFGPLQIVTYRFTAEGATVRKSRVIVVRPAHDLKVNISDLREEYRPTEGEAEFSISLLADDGKTPVAGGVSLAAVHPDEAAWARLGDSPETAAVTEDERLLQIVLGHAPGWRLPGRDDPPKAEQQNWEQAVFAAGFRTTEGNGAIPAAFLGDAAAVESDRGGRDVEADGASGEASLHSLSGRSYPEKQVVIYQKRAQALGWIVRGWEAFAAVMAVWMLMTLLGGAAAMPGGKTTLLAVGLTVIAVSIGAIVLLGSAGRHAPSAATFKSGPSALPGDDAKTAGQTGAGSRGGETSRARTDRAGRTFAETLVWLPEIGMDGAGPKPVRIPLGGTTSVWRMGAWAIAADGRMGAADWALKVYRPYSMSLRSPEGMTLNDECDIPVTVVSHDRAPQTVEVKLQPGSWYSLRKFGDDPAPTSVQLEIPPGQSRQVRFPLRILQPGKHQLAVTARSNAGPEAVDQMIEVGVEGRLVEEQFAGTLDRPSEHIVTLLEDRTPRSERSLIKIYPTRLAHLTDAMEAVSGAPAISGEQMISTLVANQLFVDHLETVRKLPGKAPAPLPEGSPVVAARARLHDGYQRLLALEAEGGGFGWFPGAPASPLLTAYALGELEELARVFPVEQAVIRRTRAWLYGKRSPKGLWIPGDGDWQHGESRKPTDEDILPYTARIASAVFFRGQMGDRSAATLKYVLGHTPSSLNDPYALALSAYAIIQIDPTNPALGEFFDRLDQLKKTNDAAGEAWWERPKSALTLMGGGGTAGRVETTAEVVLASSLAKRNQDSVRDAVRWLVTQKDRRGGWYSSLATATALRALAMAPGNFGIDEKDRVIQLRINEDVKQQIIIDSAECGAPRVIELKGLLPHVENRVQLSETSGAGASYQILSFYTSTQPAVSEAATPPPLAVSVQYDREKLKVQETVEAKAVLVNNQPRPVSHVILELPTPPGFVMEPEAWRRLKQQGAIAGYHLGSSRTMVWLRAVGAAAGPVELDYQLRAVMPASVYAPAPEAYLYYEPEMRGRGLPTRLNVDLP